MDWLGQAATQLREWLSQQAWLDGWQSTIVSTPDWALLAAGPASLLLFALLLQITWPGAPISETKSKAPQTQKQRRSANVAPASEATKSPPAAAPATKPAAAQLAASPIPTADDDEDNGSVRVFVSSTFLDMQSERDELVTKTFPALRAKYRARGVELFEVDLRWGITREQQERGETLPTLLAEIDRCRPYFIGLLGDRYGWVPPSEALTDKLKADFPILADAQGASVTAMEIMHGVLSNPDGVARACFFERDPNWDWRATLNDADRASAGEEPGSARAKLEDLKTLIRQKAHVEAYAGPEEIRGKVTAALDALLEARFPETEAPDAVEQTARLHRAYARERRGLHVGADGYMRDLNRWMETKDDAALLITGASGGGKSTLVANWINAWRKAHPSHIIFEHYLGASPDSVDPMLIMRRLWERLNRATGESVVLPGDNAELMDLSAALAQRLAQARLSAERSGAGMLVALDGLDKLSSEQNLRWLPIVPGVHWLASSLPGEAETAARAHGFATLDVGPLSEQQRRDFIAGTLKRWRRELEPQHIARILQPAEAELAGSPLYLKTVLEELRVSADNSRLAERLEDYRAARDMPNLFDRVLKRLEDDCEPGLVAKALPLIWASRAGLEETEILAITGASPLAWATLRNGLGDGLRESQGRLAFGHDFLSQAVAARYLERDDRKRSVHLALADRFQAREPDARQAEELPFQLRAAEAWERLEALLVELDRFALLRARGDGELWRYWRSLKEEQGRDPEALLCGAFEARAGDPAHWTEADDHLAGQLCDFLNFAGAYGASHTQLQRQQTTASERLYGSEHPAVAIVRNNLATLLLRTNRHGEAEPLLRRALVILEQHHGSDDISVAACINNLAQLLQDTNRHAEAEPLQRRALAITEASFGPDHPELITGLNNLAGLLFKTNRHGEAEPLLRRALVIAERSFGPDHPTVALGLNNLAQLLQDTNRHAEAEPLQRRALAITEASFGPDHHQVASALDNLAKLLMDTNRYAEAEPLYWRALTISEKSFGTEHPDVATIVNNLAMLLKFARRFAEAEPLYNRALSIDERSFGPNDPRVAADLSNLARLLVATNRLTEAEPLYRRALSISEASFGPNHPDVAIYLSNLAGLLRETHRASEAEVLYERSLAIMENSYGPDHPNVAKCLDYLAQLLQGENRVAEAEPLYRRALKILEMSLGSEHPNTQRLAANLAASVAAVEASGKR